MRIKLVQWYRKFKELNDLRYVNFLKGLKIRKITVCRLRILGSPNVIENGSRMELLIGGFSALQNWNVEKLWLKFLHCFDENTHQKRSKRRVQRRIHEDGNHRIVVKKPTTINISKENRLIRRIFCRSHLKTKIYKLKRVYRNFR